MTGRIIENSVLLHMERKRLLCVRSKGKEMFYLPGGKREAWEIPITTLIREIREELGVYIRPETIRKVGVFEGPADGKPGAIVKLTCFSASFDGQIAPSSEIEEVAWLSYNDKKRHAKAGWAVMDHLRKEGLL